MDRRIVFKADDRVLGSRRTNADGFARFTVSKDIWDGSREIKAIFNGDVYYLGSRDRLR